MRRKEITLAASKRRIERAIRGGKDRRSATEGNARWIAARGFDSPTLRKREIKH